MDTMRMLTVLALFHVTVVTGLYWFCLLGLQVKYWLPEIPFRQWPINYRHLLIGPWRAALQETRQNKSQKLHHLLFLQWPIHYRHSLSAPREVLSRKWDRINHKSFTISVSFVCYVYRHIECVSVCVCVWVGGCAQLNFNLHNLCRFTLL